MKPRHIWLVVADGSRARILSRKARHAPLEEIETLDNAAARLPGHEIVSDSPGRVYDSGGKGRHAMAAPTDPQENEKMAFLDDLAARLNSATAKNKFDDLVLFAAPQALGRLRDKLDKQAMQRVVADAPKDLTGRPVNELAKQLEDLLEAGKA
jgi:protein required for attachment to host cells